MAPVFQVLFHQEGGPYFPLSYLFRSDEMSQCDDSILYVKLTGAQGTEIFGQALLYVCL